MTSGRVLLPGGGVGVGAGAGRLKGGAAGRGVGGGSGCVDGGRDGSNRWAIGSPKAALAHSPQPIRPRTMLN